GLTWTVARRPLAPAPGGGWSPARAISFGMLATQRRSRSFLLGQPFSFAPGSVNGRSKYTAMRLVGDFLARNVREVFALSAGASLSWIPSDAITARVTYGHALKDAGGLGSKDIQDRGFHFRLTVFPLRLLGR